MEPFFDGGLFELLLVIGVAGCLNAIFRRKNLLILFSIVVMGCPLALFFVRSHDIYYALLLFCIFNSFLLVVLLWKEKKRQPQQPLFTVDRMKAKSIALKSKLHQHLKAFF